MTKEKLINKYFTIRKGKYLYCFLDDDYRINNKLNLEKNIRYMGHNNFFVDCDWHEFYTFLKKLDKKIEKNKIENNNWNFKNI